MAGKPQEKRRHGNLEMDVIIILKVIYKYKLESSSLNYIDSKLASGVRCCEYGS